MGERGREGGVVMQAQAAGLQAEQHEVMGWEWGRGITQTE